MKKCLFSFVLIGVFVFIMPFKVLAKDYIATEGYGLQECDGWQIVEGESVDFSNYFCGYSSSGSASLNSIYYNGKRYSLENNSSAGILSKELRILKYDYNDLVLSPIRKYKESNACFRVYDNNIGTDLDIDSDYSGDNNSNYYDDNDDDDGYVADDSADYINYIGDVCPGTEEYDKLIKYITNSKNKPTIRIIADIPSTCAYGILLSFIYPNNENTNISLKLDYLNVLNASKDSIEANPVSYVKEDGTIILKNLERKGYNFEGWYLDKKYQFRVTEITQKLADDYFNGTGDFANIEKRPAEEVDGELVGRIDLYAKWSSNNVIINPQTSSVIGIVVFILLIAVAGSLVVFINKKKNIVEE